MATVNTNRLRTLPLELLEEIVKQLPALDIVSVGQVDRVFHDLIHRSPQIQHTLELSAAGLEPNWRTGFTLVDRVKALEEYRSRWENLTIDRYQTVLSPTTMLPKAPVCGVYAIPMDGGIKFCTLPSSFRAIEPETHKIPLNPGVITFAFDPHADVIVVVLSIGRVLELRPLTMSEGIPHPFALGNTIECEILSTSLRGPFSITCHRVALMVENTDTNTFTLYVWDWRTGELLFEHHSPCHDFFEFLDDYRLAISVSACEDNGSPGLLFLDTERVSLMTPTWTRFRGPVSSCRTICLFDAGGYKPSPRDMLAAPFYPDPSQRILAFSMDSKWLHVVKAETLLRLAMGRVGEEIQWEEWKSCLIEAIPHTTPDTAYSVGAWVSGFRLFSASVVPGEGVYNLCVHDFSPRASMMFLHSAGDGCKVMHPSVPAFRLPWDNLCLIRIRFGHDSMVGELYSIHSVDVAEVVPDIGNL